MIKFECKKCLNNCIVLANDYYLPKTCCYDFGYKPNWHEVKEADSAENEQFGNSEQLPDWVKVGNLVYCSKTGIYGEIKTIKDNKIYLRLINTDEVLPVKLNMVLKNGRPARKRPLNADEMKALVGKVLETPHVALLVNAYGKVTKEVSTAWGNYTDEALMNRGFTLDGKPCYKLEHLENGEWVE